MSQYDINDPRNRNSPFNLRNVHSPYYNPRQDVDQTWPELGDILLWVGGVLAIGFLGLLFRNPVAAIGLVVILALIWFVVVVPIIWVVRIILESVGAQGLGWIVAGGCILFPIVMALLCVVMGM